MIKVKDVIQAMETIAPPALALTGDPIGLHAGDPEMPVRKIAVALDASLTAVAAAKRYSADMLVVHHPRFYKGLSTLAAGDPLGRRATAIVKSGLAVYSAHTNLDLAEGGTNDILADLAGLRNIGIAVREKSEQLIKLAVFVPVTHIDAVLRAVCDAGAGAIGRYSDCTFRVGGTGTFRCGADTKPFIGKPGSYEEADEYRLETAVGEFGVDRVISAMMKAHPYEEVAYDLYPMLGRAKHFGLGRVGDLAKQESVAALAKRMALATGSKMTQFSGKPGRKVKRVAVWAGGGVDARALTATGAEVVVAGELGYHDLETFSDAGVAAITLGHGHSEEPVLQPLAKRLSDLLRGVAVKAFGNIDVSFTNV